VYKREWCFGGEINRNERGGKLEGIVPSSFSK